MSQVNHENVCLFLGAHLNVADKEYTLITEYCPGGDLGDLLKDTTRYLSSFQKFMMIRDVCKGMLWLHFCGILHLEYV
jgi:serine/threonine protein kinase